MAAKQARRRKPPVAKKRAVIQLPEALVRRSALAIGLLGTAAIVLLTLRASFDVPIAELNIDAPFQRVSAMQIREAIGDQLEAGFISVRLDEVRRRVERLDWVDHASVRRVWPDQLEVVVDEQIPASRWGDHGLLNTRGELFVEQARHELAELPRLSGPKSHLREVASQYLALRGPLIEAGLGLRAVRMDSRGAWHFVLDNGIEVRLGRKDVAERAQRFIDVAAPVVARHAARIRHVNMCYSNGFAIGWKREEYRQQVRVEAAAASAALMQRDKQ